MKFMIIFLYLQVLDRMMFREASFLEMASNSSKSFRKISRVILKLAQGIASFSHSLELILKSVLPLTLSQDKASLRQNDPIQNLISKKILLASASIILRHGKKEIEDILLNKIYSKNKKSHNFIIILLEKFKIIFNHRYLAHLLISSPEVYPNLLGVYGPKEVLLKGPLNSCSLQGLDNMIAKVHSRKSLKNTNSKFNFICPMSLGNHSISILFLVMRIIWRDRRMSSLEVFDEI